MTTKPLLHSVGETLYGARWQTDLASDVRVSDRTMRRWAADEATIPEGIWQEIQRLIENRKYELELQAEAVAKHLKENSRDLFPIPNTRIRLGLLHSEFAMMTAGGKIVYVFIHREVLSDRVPASPAKLIQNYFDEHFETFCKIARRKYLLGEVEAADAVSIANADVRKGELPDERPDRADGFQTQVDQPRSGLRRP